ncbi:MAG: glycogen accumulation regulator GarA, partial [Pseudonocardiaceae bacterium]
MSTNDGPGVPPERGPEQTSVFRADFLAEPESV